MTASEFTPADRAALAEFVADPLGRAAAKLEELFREYGDDTDPTPDTTSKG